MPKSALAKPDYQLFQQALLSIGQHEFWSPESIQAKLSRIICLDMDDIRDSLDNQVLPLIDSDAMVSKMMRESPINPCHITKNIIFLLTGFDQDQMNMVALKGLCESICCSA